MKIVSKQVLTTSIQSDGTFWDSFKQEVVVSMYDPSVNIQEIHSVIRNSLRSIERSGHKKFDPATGLFGE